MAMNLSSPSGRRRGRRGKRGAMAEINVTPLVDVMLVLLVIFMVTAPLLKAAVPVDLPDSRANALAEESDEVAITLTRDGGIYMDKVRLMPGELEQRGGQERLPSGALSAPHPDEETDQHEDAGQQ